ncbi:unnamed protein product [Amoebophrya sp. A25]|nr:unnamed protein product [Amoebophrya sp. A25]|eukprot:GSA25T00005352001.1
MSTGSSDDGPKEKKTRVYNLAALDDDKEDDVEAAKVPSSKPHKKREGEQKDPASKGSKTKAKQQEDSAPVVVAAASAEDILSRYKKKNISTMDSSDQGAPTKKAKKGVAESSPPASKSSKGSKDSDQKSSVPTKKAAKEKRYRDEDDYGRSDDDRHGSAPESKSKKTSIQQKSSVDPAVSKKAKKAARGDSRSVSQRGRRQEKTSKTNEKETTTTGTSKKTAPELKSKSAKNAPTTSKQSDPLPSSRAKNAPNTSKQSDPLPSSRGSKQSSGIVLQTRKQVQEKNVQGNNSSGANSAASLQPRTKKDKDTKNLQSSASGSASTNRARSANSTDHLLVPSDVTFVEEPFKSNRSSSVPSVDDDFVSADEDDDALVSAASACRPSLSQSPRGRGDSRGRPQQGRGGGAKAAPNKKNAAKPASGTNQRAQNSSRARVEGKPNKRTAAAVTGRDTESKPSTNGKVTLTKKTDSRETKQGNPDKGTKAKAQARQADSRERDDGARPPQPENMKSKAGRVYNAGSTSGVPANGRSDSRARLPERRQEPSSERDTRVKRRRKGDCVGTFDPTLVREHFDNMRGDAACQGEGGRGHPDRVGTFDPACIERQKSRKTATMNNPFGNLETVEEDPAEDDASPSSRAGSSRATGMAAAGVGSSSFGATSGAGGSSDNMKQIQYTRIVRKKIVPHEEKDKGFKDFRKRRIREFEVLYREKIQKGEELL